MDPNKKIHVGHIDVSQTDLPDNMSYKEECLMFDRSVLPRTVGVFSEIIESNTTVRLVSVIHSFMKLDQFERCKVVEGLVLANNRNREKTTDDHVELAIRICHLIHDRGNGKKRKRTDLSDVTIELISDIIIYSWEYGLSDIAIDMFHKYPDIDRLLISVENAKPEKKAFLIDVSYSGDSSDESKQLPKLKNANHKCSINYVTHPRVKTSKS